MKEIILCDNSSLIDTVKLCQKYSLGIEVQSFHNVEYLERQYDGIEMHNSVLKNINTKSIHGPFADLCLGSSDKMIRDVTIKRFEYAYNIAKKLGCKHLILHHGYVPKTSYPPNWINRSISFLEKYMLDKNDDIKIHLENVLELDANMLFEIIERLGNNNIDICLDIGHAHCNSQVSVIEWIKLLKDKIGYVHIHDNHGLEDEHLGLGLGNMPLKEILEALEIYSHEAVWAIESKINHMEISMEWLMAQGYYIKYR